MTQHPLRLLTLPYLILTLAAVNAHSEDSPLLLIATVGYQDRLLDFDQKYVGNAENSAQFDVHLPIISTAMTAAKGSWFFTIKYEGSLAGISATSNETDRSTLLQSNLIALEGSGLDVERSDLSFTLGYNIRENFNVFIGMLDGETQLKPDPFCANPLDASPCSRTNRAFQQFFLADNGLAANQKPYTQIYSESGPYLGLTYSWAVKDYGSLSLNVAYASMEGEYQDNANDPDNVFSDPGSGLPTFVAFNYQGDTTGTSLALTWSGSLGAASAYYFDLRRQQYEMDGEDATGLPNFEGVSLKTVEEMLGLSMGLRFYF